MILPVVLVLTSVVSAGYYLPVIMAMYMKPARQKPRTTACGSRPLPPGPSPSPSRAVILFGVLAASRCSTSPGRTSEALTQTAMPSVGTRQ